MKNKEISKLEEISNRKYSIIDYHKWLRKNKIDYDCLYGTPEGEYYIKTGYSEKHDMPLFTHMNIFIYLHERKANS